MRGVVRADLLDDLPRLEVPSQAEAPRLAERAAERAADLGVGVDVVARAIETMLGGRTVTRLTFSAAPSRRSRACSDEGTEA